ncbi:MAG: hypothetical protein HYZ58_12080 [Acidobacteria bacterium]|nr:hypothetical protein [Acidobacteriota bacterium]
MRTATHIRGARNVKGFRACPASTGVPALAQEARRLVWAEVGQSNSESRRRWLVRLWEAHQARVRTRNAFQHSREHGAQEDLVR